MLDLRPKWTGVWHLRLFGEAGRELPCQEEQPESLLPFNGWRRRVCFMAETPGVGAVNYELKIFEGSREQSAKPSAISYSVDADSGLINHLDAGGGRECLAGALLQPLVVEDDGDAWGSDRWSYRNVVGKFKKESGPHVIQAGPIRTITETVFAYNHSRIVLDVYGYPEWPVIELRLRITWNEIRKRLKFSIPTVFKNDGVLCDVPGGAIMRPADGEEHVHGRWLLLGDKINGKETAFGVANNGQHGLDFMNGEVRLSVLRSAAYCHEQGLSLGEWPERKYMDIGVHDVRFAVTAGDPDLVRPLLAGLPDWLVAPPIVYAHLPIGIAPANDLKQGGKVSKQLLSLAPATVRLLACKRSWDGKSLVVRLQETMGMQATTTVRVEKAPAFNLSFRPFEIKTIRVERSGKRREVRLIEEV
jgi:alpha-mannosidase